MAFGKRESLTGQSPPWLARGGGGMAVLPSTHGRVSPCPWLLRFLCGFSTSCAIFSVLAAVLSLKEHVSRPNFIPFYNHSHSHRIARSRLKREFKGEKEDLQSDGGSSKNRKIKQSHLTKHFFLFFSLLFSQLEFMHSRLITFVLSIYFEFVVLILDLCKF